MSFRIRLMDEQDMDAVVRLSLLAWQPVFDTWQEIMGPAIFSHLYPDWKAMQQKVVEDFCRPQANRTVWVAEAGDEVEGGEVAGFLVLDLNQEEKKGDVQLLAVHPDHQRQGIAAALNQIALEKMKASGMKIAYVGTGGDPAHAAARRSYEKAGYVGLPAVHYFKEL
jgi:GNAT superfamily N-acetyltransferase